jgi:hypothetical protein
MPWRPEADPTCPNGTAWRASDGNCYNGYAFTINFDLSSLNLTLPDEIIYGIAYNTRTHGYNPIGQSGPYDSLNVGLRKATPPSVGTDPEPGVLYVYGTHAIAYGDNGADGLNVFRRDTGWNDGNQANFYSPAVRFNLTAPTMSFVPSATTFCANGATLTINLADVVNLYGYQFAVNYDKSIVNASGEFINAFVDTQNSAYFPPGWNATCSDGVCRFAVTKGPPALPISGSGDVARVTFTAVKNGTFNATLSSDILSDPDGFAIAHTTPVAAPMTVSCFAQVNGVVRLQGRVTPIDAGQVALSGGPSGWSSAQPFNATTGAFSFTDIPVSPSGTAYTFDATHLLYLGNRMIHTLMPGQNYVAPTTRLLGGDANNDTYINIGDLACIGNDFGKTAAESTCTGGSSDITADDAVNILDLTMAGSNYGKLTWIEW